MLKKKKKKSHTYQSMEFGAFFPQPLLFTAAAPSRHHFGFGSRLGLPDESQLAITAHVQDCVAQ